MDVTYLEVPPGERFAIENCLGLFEVDEGTEVHGRINATWTPEVPSNEEIRLLVVTHRNHETVAEVSGTSPLSIELAPFMAHNPNFTIDTTIRVYGAGEVNTMVDDRINIRLDLSYNATDDIQFDLGSCT